MADQLLPTSSPWRRKLHGWLTRRHTACTRHLLLRRNLYVLPSATGGLLALTLLALLLASINFQLNLGYAFTFLIAGSALASLWMGWRNMQGLQLQLGVLQPVFQGERAAVAVQLCVAQGARLRYVSVAMHRPQGALRWVHTQVAPAHTVTIELGSVPHQRGWHRVPRVVVQSCFPLGVFRIWSDWQPSSRVLVYPAPEKPVPPLAWGDASPIASTSTSTQHGHLPTHDGVRAYQRGDALHSVVWKKTATAMTTGSGNWVVRDSATQHTPHVWLQAQATQLTDLEAQIARLTAWVLHAHAQHWQWGLELPSGLRIAPAMGDQHLHHCLAALATDGLTMPADTISIK